MRRPILMISTLMLAASLVPAQALPDGIILIDQNRAMAGNITPGDAPGFPVTISQPGHYRLASFLQPPNHFSNGIEVTAPDVTLDLNGFGVLAPKCTQLICPGNGSGIWSSETLENTTVKNGVVRGFRQYGLHLGPRATVERVNSEDNQHGMALRGAASLVTECRAQNNKLVGIGVVEGSMVLRSTVIGNDSGLVNLSGKDGNAGLAGEGGNTLFGNRLPVFGNFRSVGGSIGSN